MPFRVEDFVFRIEGLRIQDLGLGIQDFVFRIEISGLGA